MKAGSNLNIRNIEEDSAMTLIIERGWLDVVVKHREGEITASNKFLRMLKDICHARVRQIFTEKQIDEMKLR